MKKKNKLLVSIIILFFVISINTIATAKYLLSYQKIIGRINLDRKPPIIQVNYSTKEPTTENVVVTIISDEPLTRKEGWNMSKDTKQLTKIYENNIEEIDTVQDLVGNKVEFKININNIDNIEPMIKLFNFNNSNIKYHNFASCKHNITFRIKICEENIIVNNLISDNISVQIGNQKSSLNLINITEIKKEKDGIIYDIRVNEIKSDGNLKLVIKDSIIMDIGNKWNKELVIDTGIVIDNKKPEIEYNEEIQDNGKSKINVLSNESIRDVIGWNITENKTNIYKEYTNNISFILKVQDFAENETKIKIEVKKATNIILTYSSQNSEIGWSFGYGNNDIAGLNAININPKYKTEALAFNVEGNIEKDFIQSRAYVYNYWGEGGTGISKENGLIYKYGYNPSATTFKSMNSTDLVNINQKKCFQFGGSGINSVGNTDINGNNPISFDNIDKYKYGISAINFILKDYSYYSIIYQIYVDQIGWMEPKYDGEEAVYAYDKPISAIRLSLVPQTEKQKVIDLWYNK